MENLNKAMIIRNGNLVGSPSVDFEELTFEQYKKMEANGEIDLNKKYLVKADDSGALLSAEDVSYDEDTSVKGKISDLDDKITKHSLPLLYDSGVRGNSSVEVYKISNVLKTASGGSDPNNLNLLLSTRGGDEVEIAGGKNDSSWFVQAKRNLSSITHKISSLYRDGLDLYIRLELYFNFLRIYHKSGVLPDDFKVERVSSIPDTATEIVIKDIENDVSKKADSQIFNRNTDYLNANRPYLKITRSASLSLVPYYACEIYIICGHAGIMGILSFNRNDSGSSCNYANISGNLGLTVEKYDDYNCWLKYTYSYSEVFTVYALNGYTPTVKAVTNTSE